jgi:predicted acyltransferase (DUF342 family)
MTRFFPLCAFALLVGLAPSTALAATADRFQVNNDIQIQANEKVGDVTCLNCSIRVTGRVAGDVTTINGNIVAEQGASISGDVTTVRGSARVENGAQVAGDLTAIAGNVRRDPQASVGGDVASLNGGGWVFLIFLVPFAVLGGIIALIIWLIQRSRQPVPVPAYTLRKTSV